MIKGRKTWSMSSTLEGKLCNRSIITGLVAIAAFGSEYVNALEESGVHGNFEYGQAEVDWSDFYQN